MEQALKEEGPVWIDCTISREERVLPMIPNGKTVEDMIIDQGGNAMHKPLKRLNTMVILDRVGSLVAETVKESILNPLLPKRLTTFVNTFA